MTDLPARIAAWLVGISLLAWLVVSPIVFVWWYFDRARRRGYVKRHERIAIAVQFGAFLSTMIVLYQGLQQALVFIPSDWGDYDEFGDFRSKRSNIASLAALLSTGFLAMVFEEVGILRSKIATLREEAQRLRQHDDDNELYDDEYDEENDLWDDNEDDEDTSWDDDEQLWNQCMDAEAWNDGEDDALRDGKEIMYEDLIAEVRKRAQTHPGNVYVPPNGQSFFTRGLCTDGSTGSVGGETAATIDEDEELAWASPPKVAEVGSAKLHETEELIVFRKFASVCPLPLARESARPGPNPPDILCNTESGETWAFELVRCDDVAVYSQRATTSEAVTGYDEFKRKIERLLQDAYEGALHAERIDHPERFHRHTVDVYFEDRASRNQRKGAVDRVIQFLNELGPGHHLIRKKHIRAINCRPWQDVYGLPSKAGPNFCVDSGYFFVAENSLAAIKKKTVKDYKCGWKLHLVAWSQTATAEELEFTGNGRVVADYLRSNGMGAFDRIWVFGLGETEIAFDSGKSGLGIADATSG